MVLMPKLIYVLQNFLVWFYKCILTKLQLLFELLSGWQEGHICSYKTSEAQGKEGPSTPNPIYCIYYLEGQLKYLYSDSPTRYSLFEVVNAWIFWDICIVCNFQNAYKSSPQPF